MSKIQKLNFDVGIIISPSGFKYVITQSPNPNNIKDYKDFLSINCVDTLIRLCLEENYDTLFLTNENINVIDQSIEDGLTPNVKKMNEWIETVKKLLKNKKKSLACHCVSGLGRAPLFVCIMLIKIENMDPIDAITLVRKKIPYSLNKNQLSFLQTLEPSNQNKNGCIIC